MLLSLIDQLAGNKAAGGTCVYLGTGPAAWAWWLNMWINPWARC